MGALGKILKVVERDLIEARLLKHIREELDEILARIGRYFLARRTKVVPNKIFFHTQENRYCCNIKYICEEFRRRNLDVDMVWRVSKDKRGNIPADCRIVTGGTYQYFKELFSSKYIFSNSVLYVKRGFRLKKEQVLFQTWHGSLGIKRFGKKDYKGGYHWVMGAIATGKMTDYCITNSSFVSDSLRNTYWENTPMLEYGHPRNDIMFENFAEKRIQIKQDFLDQYGLDGNTKFVLYGPTFRDQKNFDCYDIDFPQLTTALEDRFGGEWCVLLRFHPSLRAVYKNKKANYDNMPCRIIDVTDYDDMQELITIADVAITDYSSWIYDFMLQRRPGFIFATDISLYNNERGFCYPLETTPFPIAVNNDELIRNVRDFNEVTYLENLEAFLDEKGCIEDGHASERVVDKVLELMKSNA